MRVINYIFCGPLSKHSRFGKALDEVKGGKTFRRFLITAFYANTLRTLIDLRTTIHSLTEEPENTDHPMDPVELAEQQLAMEQDWVPGTAILRNPEHVVRREQELNENLARQTRVHARYDAEHPGVNDRAHYLNWLDQQTDEDARREAHAWSNKFSNHDEETTWEEYNTPSPDGEF